MADLHLSISDQRSFDPHKLLIYAVIAQALRDCRPTRARKDPKRAIDALTFLSVCGPEFAEVAGWQVDPDHWEKVLSEKI